MFLVYDEARSLEEFKQATREKLAGVRCPHHGQPPRLDFQGGSLRDVSISLRGCCPAVMSLANRAIYSPPAQACDRALHCPPVGFTA